jgi:hypothetical protein
MKRDMDLIRKILLAIEESPEPELPSQPLIQGSSNKQVNEHLRLLMEAGYIDALTSRGDDMIAFDWIRLLWPGHEFLAAARDDTIWNKAKTKLGGGFSTVTLAILENLLVALTRAQLGLGP